jgi:hypothetical protein
LFSVVEERVAPGPGMVTPRMVTPVSSVVVVQAKVRYPVMAV